MKLLKKVINSLIEFIEYVIDRPLPKLVGPSEKELNKIMKKYAEIGENRGDIDEKR